MPTPASDKNRRFGRAGSGAVVCWHWVLPPFSGSPGGGAMSKQIADDELAPLAARELVELGKIVARVGAEAGRLRGALAAAPPAEAFVAAVRLIQLLRCHRDLVELVSTWIEGLGWAEPPLVARARAWHRRAFAAASVELGRLLVAAVENDDSGEALDGLLRRAGLHATPEARAGAYRAAHRASRTEPGPAWAGRLEAEIRTGSPQRAVGWILAAIRGETVRVEQDGVDLRAPVRDTPALNPHSGAPLQEARLAAAQEIEHVLTSDRLTIREREILRLLAEHESLADVARALGRSESAVRTLAGRARKKIAAT